MAADHLPLSRGFGSKGSRSDELASIVQFAWPTILVLLLEQSTVAISMAFCGHLGEHEMAAVALAIAFCNITGIHPSYGLTTVIDTYGTQAVGTGNNQRLWVITLRGDLNNSFLCDIIVLMFVYLICSLCTTNSGYVTNWSALV
jgi:Na+-driven multidrug efflux pump